MKKCWILEKFATAEEMAKSYADMMTMIEMAKAEGKMKPEEIAAVEAGVANYERVMKENPDGRWYGFEGKSNYNDFCYTAKAALRRNPEGKFRVVEAEIADDAKYWTNYKFVKVNEGVYRYLMATK